MDYVRGSLKKHEAIKQKILSDPSVVGINKHQIVKIQTEFPLLKRNRPVAQPDIFIQYEDEHDMRHVFIEVKSGSCKRALQNLIVQMQKIQKFVEKERINGYVLGVYCSGNEINILSTTTKSF